MKRALMLSFGWLTASFFLYVSFILLELYWNLFDWTPKYDLRAAVLVLIIFVSLGSIFLLAGTGSQLFNLVVSLAACLCLFAVGVYVLPAEPVKTEGLLARTSASPWWYRATRFLIMVLPLFFWASAFSTRRKKQ
jgi:hypothetical protein